MVKTRQWQLAKKPANEVQLTGSEPTFKLTETELPSLKDGQLLVKSVYLSNDPAQRGWIDAHADPARLYVPPVELGAPMRARGIGQVLESKAEGFKEGDYVLGSVDWSEKSILNAKETQPAPELPGLSRTHYLGGFGTTGLTAYYGLKEITRTSPDDVVVISGAAGAAGSMAVQIAKKILGAKKVYGIAGTDDKCRWVEGLGADKCFNYKKSDWKKQLEEATPDFVNVYFDNVGGDMLDFMLTRMAKFGRIAACGAIASYNSADKYGIKNWYDVIVMRLEIRGFIVLDYFNKWQETMSVFQQALKNGKLKLGEDSEQIVPTKFEDIPKTWMMLFDGSNTGKLVTEIQ